jgi:hypothetical protein
MNIKQVVELVDSTNKLIVGEDWKEKKLNWNFTIMQETAELVESLNLKWWKDTGSEVNITSNSYNEVLDEVKVDYKNVLIELADLMIFQISKDLSKVSEVTVTPLDTEDELTYTSLSAWKNDMYYAADEHIKSKTMDSLTTLITFCKFSVEDVLITATMKTALNMLRTKYGYKEGTYKKTWDGLEDNIVVTNLASEHDFTKQGVDIFYNIIEDYYKKEVIYVN